MSANILQRQKCGDHFFPFCSSSCLGWFRRCLTLCSPLSSMLYRWRWFTSGHAYWQRSRGFVGTGRFHRKTVCSSSNRVSFVCLALYVSTVAIYRTFDVILFVFLRPRNLFQSCSAKFSFICRTKLLLTKFRVSYGGRTFDESKKYGYFGGASKIKVHIWLTRAFVVYFDDIIKSNVEKEKRRAPV